MWVANVNPQIAFQILALNYQWELYNLSHHNKYKQLTVKLLMSQHNVTLTIHNSYSWCTNSIHSRTRVMDTGNVPVVQPKVNGNIQLWSVAIIFNSNTLSCYVVPISTFIKCNTRVKQVMPQNNCTVYSACFPYCNSSTNSYAGIGQYFIRTCTASVVRDL